MSEQLSTRPIELSNEEAATVLKAYLENIRKTFGADAERALYEVIYVLEGKDVLISRWFSDTDIVDILNNIINCTPIPRGDGKSMTHMIDLLALCKAMKVFEERVAYHRSMKMLLSMPVCHLTDPTINKMAEDAIICLDQLKEIAKNGSKDSQN